MWSRLVRQKGRFIERIHLIPVRNPRIQILYSYTSDSFKKTTFDQFANWKLWKLVSHLVRLIEKVFIYRKHVSKLIQEDLSNSVIDYLNFHVAFQVATNQRRLSIGGIVIDTHSFSFFIKNA